MKKIDCVKQPTELRTFIYHCLYKFAYSVWKVFRRFFLKNTHGAQVVFWKGNELLLVKACYRDCYCFPGGYIKPREEPIEAARRELEEETGLLLLASQLKFEIDLKFECHKTHCKDSLFEFRAEPGSLFTPKPDGREIVEAKFFSREELVNLTLDHNVKKYLEYRYAPIKAFAKCKAIRKQFAN